MVVPVGGGGLISGITVAAESRKSDVKIIGMETEAVPALTRSLAEGVWPERYPVVPSLAGGLGQG